MSHVEVCQLLNHMSDETKGKPNHKDLMKKCMLKMRLLGHLNNFFPPNLFTNSLTVPKGGGEKERECNMLTRFKKALLPNVIVPIGSMQTKLMIWKNHKPTCPLFLSLTPASFHA